LPWNELFVTDGMINWAGAKRVTSLSDRGWHVVVSSEGGLGSLQSMYEQAGVVTEGLTRIVGSENLRIVVYIRPQHEWCESAYAQYVEEGGSRGGDCFASALLERPHFRFSNLTKSILRCTEGTVRIRPYVGSDTVNDFFTIAELGEVPAYLSGIRARSSRTRAETAVLRALNERNQGNAAQTIERGLANGPSLAHLEGSLFSGSVREELFGVFQEDWLELQGLDRLTRADRSQIGIAMQQVPPVAIREHIHVMAEDVDSALEPPVGARHSEPQRNGQAFENAKNHVLRAVRHGPRSSLLRWMSR